MADLYHQMGSDLVLDATGDLRVAGDTQITKQRILRRLLTPSASYLWQLDYGSNLPGFVGSPANAQRLAAVIRAQMLLEDGVAKLPVPTVNVAVQPDGVVMATLNYVDAQSGEMMILTCSVQGKGT